MNMAVRKSLRSCAYVLLKCITDISCLFPNRKKSVPILVYHRICPLYFNKNISYANVYPEEFDKQMKYLKENYEVITISEYLMRSVNNQLNGNEVCITFDDGFKDNYIYGYPILKKYNLKATYFLTTKYIGTNTIFPWMTLDEGAKKDISVNREHWLPLSWEEVQEMIGYGMEFGTHTHTHKDSLSNLDTESAEEEIDKCTKTFIEKTGTCPDIFSYPHGTFKDYNDVHIELLKSYRYKAALTTNAGRNDYFVNPYKLKRLIIYEEDSLWEFKKKLRGAYDIAEKLQRLWLNAAGSKPN